MDYSSKIKNLLSRNCLYYICFYFLRLTKLERLVPDRPFLKLKYRCYMRQKLHLTPPVTYNEKLQWLKLYDRNPLYTTLVDKYRVKDYISNIIGPEYIIPTIGVWEKVDDIDINELPQQFVLKCNHDSGGVVICKDKNSFDFKKAKKKLASHLKSDDAYYAGREWPYKDVKKCIIAEKYMEDNETKELRDYKFFCFYGEVKAMFIASDRQRRKEPYFDFFDTQFNNLGIKQGHPNAPFPIEKPKCFEAMKALASKLSKDLRAVRVDLYEVNGKVYFGEMTLFHHTGMVPFIPSYWDTTFGEWLKLPMDSPGRFITD